MFHHFFKKGKDYQRVTERITVCVTLILGVTSVVMISVWKPIVLFLLIVIIVKIFLLMRAHHNARRGGGRRLAKDDSRAEDEVQALTLRLQAVDSERRLFSEKIESQKNELARAQESLEKREASLRKFLERTIHGLSSRVDEVLRGRDAGILRRVLDDFRKATDVSQKDLRLNPHVFFLKPLLSELEEESRALRVTKDIGLAVDLAEGFSLYADPDAVKKILLGILTGLHPLCQAGDAYKIIVGDGEAWTRLAIFKSGEGIPAEDLADVFEAFPKFSDRDATGQAADLGHSGLDLMLAKRLVEAQNGQITAENLPNGGCRLLITFPKKA